MRGAGDDGVTPRRIVLSRETMLDIKPVYDDFDFLLTGDKKVEMKMRYY